MIFIFLVQKNNIKMLVVVYVYIFLYWSSSDFVTLCKWDSGIVSFKGRKVSRSTRESSLDVLESISNIWEGNSKRPYDDEKNLDFQSFIPNRVYWADDYMLYINVGEFILWMKGLHARHNCSKKGGWSKKLKSHMCGCMTSKIHNCVFFMMSKSSKCKNWSFSTSKMLILFFKIFLLFYFFVQNGQIWVKFFWKIWISQ